jgi:chitinase
VILAQDVSVRGGPPDASSRRRTFPTHVFAPYLDVTLKPPVSFIGTASSAGVKYFTLAFVINSEKGGCRATWNGSIPISEEYLLSEITALRAKGGDVIVSFGGEGSTELATACNDPAKLEIQYQSVISTYGLTNLDFDIEGHSLADPIANDRRNKIISDLQRKNSAPGHDLNISFTLPVSPSGLTPAAIEILKNAVENKVDVTMVNIMTMDYGDAAVANKMAETAIEAADKTVKQLETIFPKRSAAEIRAMIGITPMIGTNDTKPEVFTLANAKELLDYAKTHHAGRISMWSLNRDKRCTQTTTSASPVCSGISQEPFAFSSIFKEFTQ